MNVESTALVTGVVQGVNFRWHCAQLARKNRVSGYAKNLDDGSVQVSACGEESRVDAFLSELRSTRPLAGRVDSVNQVFRRPCEELPKGFSML